MSEFNVIGSFSDEEECAHAIKALRHAALGAVRVFAPFPSERIQEAMELPKSPVRVWVLIGGILGALSGFALTIGLSLTWPHPTGGKPIVSIPPYVIIAFELMILFGALSGLIGFLVHGRFPRFESISGYSSRFGRDRFGVVVQCDSSDTPRAEALMNQAGAEDVAREAA